MKLSIVVICSVLLGVVRIVLMLKEKIDLQTGFSYGICLSFDVVLEKKHGLRCVTIET